MKKILVILFSLAIITPSIVLAHGGRTNSSGCHNNRKTGSYHCHNSKKSISKSSRTSSRSTVRKDKNCSDFSTQKQAQKFFERAGGPLIDPHDLDRDSDGMACEYLS